MKPKNRLACLLRGKAARGALWVLIGLVAGVGIREAMTRGKVRAEGNAPVSGSGHGVLDPGESGDRERPPSEAVAAALAANGGAPTMGEVLGAVGLDRYVKLARFLAGASAEECEALTNSIKEWNAYSLHFKDMINLRWAEVDPVGAAKAGGSAAVWAWAKSDPEAALAYALKKDRSMAGSVLLAIAQDSAEEGAALLREHPDLGKYRVWEGMRSSLARTDLRAAAEVALARGVPLDGTLKRWTDNDPEGALAFALGQEDARDRAKALKEVLGKLLEGDPGRALEVVAGLPPGGMRRELQNDLLKRAAQTDPAMASEWARALPLENDRGHALRLVATEVCLRDPDLALGLLLETDSPNAGENRDPFSGLISDDRLGRALEETDSPNAGGNGDPFSGLIRDDPLGRALAATRPVETLEALAGRGGSEGDAGRIAGFWVQTDPPAASAWIGDQPAGPMRDALVGGLVNGMLQDGDPDFASAAVWALSLERETPNSQQPQVLQGVFRSWLRRDRAAALAAMAHEGMPPEVRAMAEREAERNP